jgi:hypothetical protein
VIAQSAAANESTRTLLTGFITAFEVSVETIL